MKSSIRPLSFGLQFNNGLNIRTLGATRTKYEAVEIRRVGTGNGGGLIYLAHAFLNVRGEAAGDDTATAVHTLDNIGGDGGVRLAEHVDPTLAPALLGGLASTGVVVVVASGGGRRRTRRPDAELLLLGVDAAVQAEARDAVALGRDVRHGAVEELLEATQRQLPAGAGRFYRSDRGSGEKLGVGS